MAAMTTTTSSAGISNNNNNSCGIGFFNFRSNSSRAGVRHHSSPAAGASCSKLDGVAMWLVNGVAAAFFASLDSCSCIRIATVEDVDDGNDAPLILNDGNVTPPPYGGGGRRRTTRGKKQQAAILYGGF